MGDLGRTLVAAALLGSVTAGCGPSSGGGQRTAAAAAPATHHQAPFAQVATNLPAQLVPLPQDYLVNGGDPVHVPIEIESDRFSDRHPTTAPGVLKVVTWNVEWGRHSVKVADQLAIDPALADADVLVLTEVARHDPESRPAGLNQARRLARSLRMDYVIAPEWDRRLEVQGGGEHGTAILSKYPIGNLTHLRHTPTYDHYGKLGRIGGRHTLGADLMVAGHRIRLYAVHFATRDLGPGRAQQLAEVLADANRPGRPPLQILAGDLNTWTCNPLRYDCTLPPAAEPAVRDLLAAGWDDSTAGFKSFTQLGIGFFPQRLDWIFSRGLAVVPGGRAVPTDASDHLPLYAEFALP